MAQRPPTVSTPATGLAPWPHYADDEIAAVSRVLASGKVNYWTGQEARLFEEEYAKAVGSKHAIALANGTVALELALFAFGIGPGDEVVTTPRTFIASASSVVLRGAVPVLCDVDRDTQNITAGTIEKVITPRTKAIIVVHLGGWPCDMDPILALAEKHGLKVIEDCAQANGATYKGRAVGSIGHAGAFSFCQDKIVTTGGEGGLLTTNDRGVWERAWSFKDHGKSYAAMYERTHPPGFRWVHESFGTNGRMTEMQAAIGRLQLRKLPAWVHAREANALRIAKTLAEFRALRVPMPPADVGHAWYKLCVYVRPEALAPDWSRDRIMEAIVKEGVPCYSGTCSEIYREKAFTDAKLGPKERLPVAKELGETSLLFLVHPTLTEEDLAKTCRAITSVMQKAEGSAS
jgi:dTDP-4-amino-4,6-dideoxygalactose transaminase